MKASNVLYLGCQPTRSRVWVQSTTLPTPPSVLVNGGTARPANRGARVAARQMASRVIGASSAASSVSPAAPRSRQATAAAAASA